MRPLVLVASLGPALVFGTIAGCELAYPTHEADEPTDSSASVDVSSDVSSDASSEANDASKDAGPDTKDAFIPGKCKPTGLYCGNDKIPGDPNVLYKCVADADAVVAEKCEAGCEVAPPGFDDDCVR